LDNIPISSEILNLFSTWADHFKNKLTETGVPGLIQKYKDIVDNVNNQKCPHGNDYQNCCGISYEYYNDISVRTALQILIDNLSDKESNQIIQEINSIDLIHKKLIIDNPVNYGKEYHLKKHKWWENLLPMGVVE